MEICRIFSKGCLTNKRLSMRKIHEVLRLHFGHDRVKREIARVINVSPSTISDYVARAKLAGLCSPLPADYDDAALARLLFPTSEPSAVQCPAPTWPTVHDELQRKFATLELLWQGSRPSNRTVTSTVRLRALSSLAPATGDVDATDTNPWRTPHCRLRRPDRRRDQRQHP